ncbi:MULTISPECIES: hypothetical protein, partial [unclassified Microcoleus]|uniref:hypothetical protein n=1 Tax=unclassified Microcoleus TaxID=2642155 RepID=UPI0025DF889D
KKPQMIAEQLFEVLRILNSFEIKSDRISAECGFYTQLVCYINGIFSFFPVSNSQFYISTKTAVYC